MIEAKRVTNEDTGVEIGRVEAAGVQCCRQRAARFGNSASIRAVRLCKSGSIGARRHQFASSAASKAA
jgi:hypothetical protein